jgi:ABC-2 type transport system ATP-binding protein
LRTTTAHGVEQQGRVVDAGAPVEVSGLSKVYGEQRAVDDLSFAIAPGRVTGFLGPIGAGKTTTLRILLGLAAPTSGEARVFGRRYVDLDEPSRTVGALIDATGFHPGRRARYELAVHAAAGGIDDARVPVVLEEVGLGAAADKRIGALSLGMRQRLGLAAALLGEPALLILDEPANGLDPAGMHWLRDLLTGYARRGATVLVSSHVLAELALFADDVVVVDHGRLVAQASVAELVASGAERVFVRSPQLDVLARLVTASGGDVVAASDGIEIIGLTATAVGDLAAGAGLTLHQLRTEAQTLEELFLALTGDDGGIR